MGLPESDSPDPLHRRSSAVGFWFSDSGDRGDDGDFGD
jgi:hypothetical protein